MMVKVVVFRKIAFVNSGSDRGTCWHSNDSQGPSLVDSTDLEFQSAIFDQGAADCFQLLTGSRQDQ